ncbi:MAG: hypothetical protein U0797_17480 [Gemmataceae bacterium]
MIAFPSDGRVTGVRALAALAAVVLCWSPLAGPAVAVQAGGGVKLDFLDRPGAEGKQIPPTYAFRRWGAAEKEFVTRVFRRAERRTPGLAGRVGAWRPLRLYRVSQVSGPNLGLVAMPMLSAVFFPDVFFLRYYGESTTAAETLAIHEFAHLADPFYRVSWGPEWVGLVRPRLERAAERVARETGVGISTLYATPARLWTAKQKAALEVAAREEGLPSAYAGLDMAEALAEFTTSLVTGGHAAAGPEVREFLGRWLLGPASAPDTLTLAMRRALEAVEKGDRLTARKSFTEATQADPYLVTAWLGRAEVSTDLDVGKALADFDQAILLTSTFEGRPLAVRGQFHARRGETALAINDFTKSLELNPAQTEVYMQRAACWSRSKQPAKVVGDCTLALRFAPRSAEIHLVRGAHYEALGNQVKALQDYDWAIRFDDKLFLAHLRRAWIKATSPVDALRDGKRAVVDARRAGELSGWKPAEVFDTLAAAHAEVGDFDKAVEFQTKALAGAKDEFKAPWRERLALYRQHRPYRAPQ